MLSVFFTDEPVVDFASARATETWRFPPFFHALLDAGVYPPCSAFETWFVSTALDDDAFDRIAAALPAAARAAAEATEAGMTEKTIVHVMRHGEVYNPDKILYGRLPDFHLSERGRAQARGSPTGWPATTSSTSSPRRWSARRRPRRPIAAHARPGDRHRRRPHRVGERLRGRAGLTRRRRAARPPQLVASAQPAHAVVGRAVRGDRGADDRRRCTGPGTKAAGHEAVCVSHQLPVETLRRSMTGSAAAPLPDRGDVCNLASLTSFYFHGDA